MRTVAKYSVVADLADDRVASAIERLHVVVQDWLDQKGEWAESDGSFEITYADGRVAKLEPEMIETDSGRLDRHVLREPTDRGQFETAISVARYGSRVLVFCELRAGNPGTVVAPVFFDVRTPRVLQDLLALELPWRVGRTPIGCEPRRFLAREGGSEFARLLQDPTRDVPVVAISELEGFPISPDLDRRIAQDLCGTALVAKLDDGASRALTRECGTEWACYNGAVRIFWPALRLDGNPFHHPFWTADRLVQGDPSAEALRNAAIKVRRLLRTRVFSATALSIEQPLEFQKLSDARKLEMHDSSDFEGVLGLVEAERDKARDDLRQAKDHIEVLMTDVENLQLRLDHVNAVEDAEDLAPDTEIAPTTVEAALASARKDLSDCVVFGADVDTGARGLAAGAGPPEKVLRFLRTLGEMAETMRDDGSLGTAMAKWLSDRNCPTSTESETIRKNDDEMGKRTWEDGAGSMRRFELHMKPVEGASPDRCVRIYFDYDATLKMAIVGWVGRHP